MGKVDVIQAIFESFELIKLHYKEVIIPLIALLLFAAAGSGGGNSFSRGFSDSSSSSGSSPFSSSMIANAMSDSGLLATGGLLVVVIAAVILFAILLSILDRAVWFYVYEHFYSILLKKKVSPDWKSRMKRNSMKAAVLLIFWAIVVLVVFALPAVQLWNVVSGLHSPSTDAFITALLSLLVVFLLALLVVLLLGFLLTPLWIFYAMDGCGFFESLSKAANLVVGNLATFIVLGFIFALLMVGEIFVAIAACCVSFIVAPLLSVFFGLLWGVTLMKVKLALEKK